MKRLIALRKRHQAFGRGTLEILSPDNPKTLAFVRRHGDERVLVVANLSRFAQCTWMELAEFKGMRPVEMLGLASFPVIGEGTYCVTLGPYAFYWFLLRPQAEPGRVEAAAPPALSVSSAAGWEGVFRGKGRQELEVALPGYLQSRRWFQGQSRTLKSATVRDTIKVPRTGGSDRIALVQADYAEGDPELYVAPLAFSADGAAGPAVARLTVRTRIGEEGVHGVLYDPSADRDFVGPLIDAALKGGALEGDEGDLRGEPAAEAPPPAETAPEAPPHLLELSNTTAVLDGRGLLLKLYRRVEEGIHPEMEVLRRFAKTGAFPHTPSLLGVLEYQPETGGPITVGIVRQFIPGEGDAWRLTLDALRRFFDHVLTGNLPPPALEAGPRSVVDLSEQEIPEQAREMLGSYLETARLMARRTAEMHVALAAGADDPAFAPEPFTPMYQRSLYQSMREQLRLTLAHLRSACPCCRRRCASRPSASCAARRPCCGRRGAFWTESTRCASAATAIITSGIWCRSAATS